MAEPNVSEVVSREGPYLTAALVCERIIEEKDNVKTLVRVVDTYTVGLEVVDGQGLPPDLALDRIPIPLHIYLRFVAGGFVGRKLLRLVADTSEYPDILDGSADLTGEIPFAEHPAGPLAAIDVVVNLTVQPRGEGIIWLDVYLDDRWYTRFAVKFVRTPPTTTPSLPDRDTEQEAAAPSREERAVE